MPKGAHTVYSISEWLVDGYNMFCTEHADVVWLGQLNVSDQCKAMQHISVGALHATRAPHHPCTGSWRALGACLNWR